MGTLPRVGVIGTGRMGLALGGALGRAGYCVRFGSADPHFARARTGLIDVTDWIDAAEHADIAVIALPWHSTTRLPSIAEAVAGKVVVTCTNAETAGGLAIDSGESATGAIARALPAARVVAAFNHVYAELLDANVTFDGGRPSLFLCGDDALANGQVEEMARRLGFDPVRTGPLAVAHFVEGLAALMVNLVRGAGAPPDSLALRLMARTVGPNQRAITSEVIDRRR